MIYIKTLQNYLAYLCFVFYLEHLDKLVYFNSLSNLDYLCCDPMTELDGDQPVVFYYIDPGHALERHAGKLKFKNKFYYQYQREESWTRPGVRAFGRVNGGLAFQGFQKIAGNAVPLCHVLYADKAGSTKHCSHHPIYGI